MLLSQDELTQLLNLCYNYQSGTLCIDTPAFNVGDEKGHAVLLFANNGCTMLYNGVTYNKVDFADVHQPGYVNDRLVIIRFRNNEGRYVYIEFKAQPDVEQYSLADLFDAGYLMPKRVEDSRKRNWTIHGQGFTIKFSMTKSMLTKEMNSGSVGIFVISEKTKTECYIPKNSILFMTDGEDNETDN